VRKGSSWQFDRSAANVLWLHRLQEKHHQPLLASGTITRSLAYYLLQSTASITEYAAYYRAMPESQRPLFLQALTAVRQEFLTLGVDAAQLEIILNQLV